MADEQKLDCFVLFLCAMGKLQANRHLSLPEERGNGNKVQLGSSLVAPTRHVGDTCLFLVVLLS